MTPKPAPNRALAKVLTGTKRPPAATPTSTSSTPKPAIDRERQRKVTLDLIDEDLDQVRVLGTFDVEHPSPDIRELADSIRELGIMDPLHIERLPSGRFLLIAGARRRRAALLVGLTEVPVVVYVSVPQALRTALQLAENLKRKSLTPAELKAGYRRLIEELEGDVPAAARLLALTPRRLYQVLSGKPQTPKVPATPNSIARQLHRFADASSELDKEARATLLEAAHTLVKKLEGKRSRSSSG